MFFCCCFGVTGLLIQLTSYMITLTSSSLDFTGCLLCLMFKKRSQVLPHERNRNHLYLMSNKCLIEGLNDPVYQVECQSQWKCLRVDKSAMLSNPLQLSFLLKRSSFCHFDVFLKTNKTVKYNWFSFCPDRTDNTI